MSGLSNGTIYSSDGYEVTIADGSVISSNIRAIPLSGSDGFNNRIITVDSSGRPIITGAGIAGTPAGGVLSIQGVVGGVAIPISGSITATNPSVSTNNTAIPGSSTLVGGSDGTNLRPLSTDTNGYLNVNASFSETKLQTFSVVSTATATALNKSMMSIQNGTGSTILVKIHAIYIINVQTTAVTGVVATFEMRRFGSHTAGSLINTSEDMDSIDLVSPSITIRTGATINAESTKLIRRWVYGTDEWGVGALDKEGNDHILQTLMPAFKVENQNLKPLTLRANEGVHIKCITNTTTGLFDIIIVFSQE